MGFWVGMLLKWPMASVIPPIPTSGLIGEWLLNGNTNDTSWYWNNGTPNDITYTTGHWWVQCAVFNGTSSYITLPYTAINNLSAWSISVWVQRDISQFWLQQLFVDKTTIWVSNRLQMGFEYFSPWNQIRFVVNDINLSSTVTPTSDWIHFVWTFDNVRMKWYANGEFWTQNNDPISIPNSSETIYLWALWCNGAYIANFLNGKMQGMRVYDRVLSDAEIEALYLNGK